MTDWKDICALDEIEDGAIRAVELDGEAWLVSRSGDSVAAIEGTCPHAGAPLAEGAVQDDAVICPFHHAIFALRSGERLAGPGCGDLRSRAASVEDGRVKLGPVLSGAFAEATAASDSVYAIVGAGAAGLACALELRALGASGRIVLIDEDEDPLYERTMLSKGALAGETTVAETARAPAGALAQAGIETLFGRKVEALSADRREIGFADGARLTYSTCFVATGAAARRPDWAGAALDGVFTLRKPDDLTAIAAALDGAESVAVIGGGFIGMEAAASLAKRGHAPTLLVRESMLLDGRYGEDVSAMLADKLDGLGCSVRLGAEVDALRSEDGRVSAVALKGGETVAAQAVLAAIGATRSAPFLDGVETREDGAVAVDAALSAAPGLHIGGDLAAKPDSDGHTPTGHWRAAERDGRLAAARMCGARPRTEQEIPFVWSAVGGPLHILGRATGDHVDYGSVTEGDFTRFFTEGERVVGAFGAGDRDVTADLHALMRTRDGCRLRDLAKAGWTTRRAA
jgi:NADPH-dependent 2,4-dienoyl-CoA reductase/sulfur reductase-like enzyme/nitrite reductase/ring-hydroxylating ferredoxin subunit